MFDRDCMVIGSSSWLNYRLNSGVLIRSPIYNLSFNLQSICNPLRESIVKVASLPLNESVPMKVSTDDKRSV